MVPEKEILRITQQARRHAKQHYFNKISESSYIEGAKTEYELGLSRFKIFLDLVAETQALNKGERRQLTQDELLELFSKAN